MREHIESGLIFGEHVGRSIDDTPIDAEDEGRGRGAIDARLRVRRAEADGVQIEVQFVPASRRVYRVSLIWPQGLEQEGVQGLMQQGRTLSAALRERLGEGTLSSRKTRTTRTWTQPDRVTTFLFQTHNNVAGYYAELSVVTVSSISLEAFLQEA